jgi:septum formation protein
MTSPNAKPLWRGSSPLVLASKSPTRRALLESLGLPILAFDSSIDERAIEQKIIEDGGDARAIAKALAAGKALRVSRDHPRMLVLGADQTLDFPGARFNKPDSRTSARQQLRALSGHEHQLHSAAAMALDGRLVFEALDTARLWMRDFSDAFLDAYLDAAGEDVLGSVGAYRIEGLGAHLFDRVEGEHATILGLPLRMILTFLRREGYILG